MRSRGQAKAFPRASIVFVLCEVNRHSTTIPIFLCTPYNGRVRQTVSKGHNSLEEDHQTKGGGIRWTNP